MCRVYPVYLCCMHAGKNKPCSAVKMFLQPMKEGQKIYRALIPVNKYEIMLYAAATATKVCQLLLKICILLSLIRLFIIIPPFFSFYHYINGISIQS